LTNIEFAQEFARRAHRGQTDKAGVDYIRHPMAVAEKVYTDDAKVVALLHDVLEDTEVSEATIRAMFGGTIADAVVALTRRPGEPYMDFVARAKENPIARVVKIADIEHNSDLSRLKTVTKEDLDRTEKYRKALKFLREDDRRQESGGTNG
jgi:(p)ppGpp synthase/HD superfamily hydrolase